MQLSISRCEASLHLNSVMSLATVQSAAAIAAL
jgi:hypothetical protein